MIYFLYYSTYIISIRVLVLSRYFAAIFFCTIYASIFHVSSFLIRHLTCPRCSSRQPFPFSNSKTNTLTHLFYHLTHFVAPPNTFHFCLALHLIYLTVLIMYYFYNYQGILYSPLLLAYLCI